jgi:hypothetical protein
MPRRGEVAAARKWGIAGAHKSDCHRAYPSCEGDYRIARRRLQPYTLLPGAPVSANKRRLLVIFRANSPDAYGRDPDTQGTRASPLNLDSNHQSLFPAKCGVQSPSLLAGLSRKSEPSRIYLRTVARDRWPVCCMIATSFAPLRYAWVASPARRL